jgi:hypothetical protein
MFNQTRRIVTFVTFAAARHPFSASAAATTAPMPAST